MRLSCRESAVVASGWPQNSTALLGQTRHSPLAHKLQELQVHVPLLRAGGRLFTKVKRPPEPLLVRPLERVPVLLRGGKVFNHPKNPRSPTHNVTQERRTQTLRSLGCHRSLMLLEAHRHRGESRQVTKLSLNLFGKTIR